MAEFYRKGVEFMMDLKGKVAIVAAASSGLGKAIAKEFASLGADVVICGRNSDRLGQAVQEIKGETGRDIDMAVADVGRASDVAGLARHTLSIHGHIDILVTNAGGPPGGTFADFSDEDWQAAFEVNLLSVVRLIRAVLPSMKQQNSGSILNIISTSAKEPIPGLILSNVYRAGVVGLAKTLSRELAGNHIRVNNIAPGSIDTDRIRSLIAYRAANQGITVEAALQQASSSIPLGRIGTPAEFANAAAFLVSDAASYITGVTLQVDGGMVKTVM